MTKLHVALHKKRHAIFRVTTVTHITYYVSAVIFPSPLAHVVTSIACAITLFLEYLAEQARIDEAKRIEHENQV